MANLESVRSNKWDLFFVELQSQGRYAFTLEELRHRFKSSDKTLLQGLYRYKTKKQIAQIRKGFYVIIPPNYSNQGMLPPYLFIDDLMKSLNKTYYVALLSAAAVHGAAHQQPMEYFVIAETAAPRSINNKKLKVSFFSKNSWDQDDIVQKTTDAGYLNVSSPELTALDLLAYVDKIGINRAVTVLVELAQAMKASALSQTAKRYPTTTVIQRLGYILDKTLGEEKLSDTLLKILNERNVSPVLLVTQKEKQGELDEIWKVIKNIEIESDL
jgi:predicted transcriptional regulator of viral defense system